MRKPPEDWLEAVYRKAADVQIREARTIRAVQVSPEWMEKHGPVKTIWGIAVEVDPLLWGEGFRVVPA